MPGGDIKVEVETFSTNPDDYELIVSAKTYNDADEVTGEVKIRLHPDEAAWLSVQLEKSTDKADGLVKGNR